MEDQIQNRGTVQSSQLRDGTRTRSGTRTGKSKLTPRELKNNQKEIGEELDTQIVFINDSINSSLDDCITSNLQRVSSEVIPKQDVDTSICDQIVGMLLFSLSMVIFSLTTMLIKMTIKKFQITAYELTYYQALVCLVYMSLNMKIHR